MTLSLTQLREKAEERKSLYLDMHLEPEEIIALLDDLKTAREALEELQLSHVHDESNMEYRATSDTRGWCSICQEKVSKHEDIARQALEKMKVVE